MKNIKQIIFAFIILTVVTLSCKKSSSTENGMIKKDSKGFSYETFANDPTGLRLYTLKNGLKVYLSQNKDEPKIQTYIGVKAGSNYDPKKSTGLAHYLEHMLFKGTHKIGTINWEKEKPYLEKIALLYKKYRLEKDPEKKKAIYKKIDSVSYEASNFSIANEYDKMASSIGASNTNAHTWVEETVYQNIIPSNELNKWIDLESERFGKLVLRLFHTELEAVFEEFNRGQDNDYRKIYAAMLDGLFPKHPYGQQSTIGKAEHLKNPSMFDIQNYFKKYYVPNNMAIVLVGDLEFEPTISKINETFGKMKNKDLKHPVLPKEDPITKHIVKEVFGPTSESVSIAFRSKGINSEEEKYLTLCDMILNNAYAGLIDLNLNQKQLVQSAYSSITFLNDYGYQSFNGSPKKGQTLDEVKNLILQQIEKLKKGEFDNWMINAVVNNLKLDKIKEYDNITSLADSYLNSFIHNQNWSDKIKFINDLKKISKEELVKFANNFYKDNYVVIYKRKGIDNKIVKVQNPGITPVKLNRGKSSDYLLAFNKLQSKPLQPKFVDYKKEIKKLKTKNNIEVFNINNINNDFFELFFIFDIGKNNSKKLSLAANYIKYLGTDKYSAEDIKKEMYKLGITYSISTSSDKTLIELTGLKENLSKGLSLLEDFWTNLKPDEEAYKKYINKIYKSRIDRKTQKSQILRNGLVNYGKYGENSPLRDIFQIDELKAINPKDLVALIKGLKNYKQKIFYYGKDVNSVIDNLNKTYKIPGEIKPYPEKKIFKELETDGNVFFTNYNMVQCELIFLAKSKPFNPKNIAASMLFNNYFGSGLSSIVFQEIRESKSLAYSAYSYYSNAREKDKSNYLISYIGTQSNKLEQAVNAMMSLLNNDMIEAKKQFEDAKESTLKKIASERITKSNIFWNYERLKKLGIDYDNRKEIYNSIKNMTIEDLKSFFNENIKGEKYNVLVIGNKKDIQIKTLKKLGKVKELDVDFLFNYQDNKKVIK